MATPADRSLNEAKQRAAHARAASLTPDRRSEIARIAAHAKHRRWLIRMGFLDLNEQKAIQQRREDFFGAGQKVKAS